MTTRYHGGNPSALLTKPGCPAKSVRLPADELAEEVRRLEGLGYTVTHRTPDRTKEETDAT